MNIVIEAIRLFADADLYSVLIVRCDSDNIRQSVRFFLSESSAKKYVKKKHKLFEKAGRKVIERWHRNEEATKIFTK